MAHSYVVVDLETTGNAFNRGDRIIQISAVVVKNNEIIEQYSSFLHPQKTIPPFIKEFTGIDDEMVKDAPRFEQIAGKMHQLLVDHIFVAHNVAFDLNFLQGEMKAAGYPLLIKETIDTVELAKIMMPTAQSYKLSDLTQSLGIVHENPHQADSDALATAEMLIYLIGKVEQLPIVTLERLADLGTKLESDISQLFNSVLKSKRRKIENLHNDLEVFRGIALKKKSLPQMRPNEQFDVSYPNSKNEKIALFKNKFAGFHARDGQLDMMDSIYEAFTSEHHLVLEAGTGTGKSLGYLIPALYFSVQTDQQIIISTYTTHMQDQLINSELKKLQDMVPFSFQATILKGRNHYIHLLKFEQSLLDPNSRYDDALSKMQILVWLIETETGDLEEINLSSGGHIFIKRIKHDGWFFPKEKDPWYARDFYVHARLLATHADLIITNHSMLFAEIEFEKEFLPKQKFIIIDEAHHLENAARHSFSKKLKYQAVKFLLGRLGNLDKNALFAKLERILDIHGIVPSIHKLEVDLAITNLDSEIDDFFSLLSRLFQFKHSHSKVQYRITDEIRNGHEWRREGPLMLCADRWLHSHQLIRNSLEERLSLIQSNVKRIPEMEKAFLEELNSFLQSWIHIEHMLESIFFSPDHNSIFWMEGDVRALPNTISIFEQPQHIDSLLSENFFDKNKSVVMTSATLTVNQSFDYFLEQVGLKHHHIKSKIIPSSFQFDQMAKLIIPTDLPSLKDSSDNYVEAISNHIIGIAEAAEGRTLVLFTSYDMLRKTYDLILDSGSLEEFVVLAQGITAGSRTRLIKSFQQLEKAILFGTSSFWEGIDIPGKDLSCLVIVRLPFSPPDDPMVAAKAEVLKQRGENPFLKLSLPQAVIRFRQGFGRLIRGELDRGVVIVLDQRIDSTSYGEVFLSSIPNVTVERGPINKIVSIIEDWL